VEEASPGEEEGGDRFTEKALPVSDNFIIEQSLFAII